MKKLTALFLGLLMILGLAACGSETPSPSTSTTPESSTPTSQLESSTSELTESDSPEAGGTLVVYFSATGNTEEAANYIAEITNGDLFKLEPADPYTSEDLNYSDESSRVVYEHDNPDARDVALVADTLDNWDAYDTIFIGYPKIQYGFLSV